MRFFRAFLTVAIIFIVWGANCLASGRGQEEDSGSVGKPEFTIQVERNVVLVRVVVRDSEGRPVRNLSKDDFELFDNGKRQVISQFAAEGEEDQEETSQPAPEAVSARPTAIKPAVPTAEEPNAEIPDHFVAFYFDDLMMKPGDIIRTRAAANRYLASTLRADERVGIFTASGEQNLDFTPDRDRLHEALGRLTSRTRLTPSEFACPDISDYEAFLIIVRNDRDALEIAMEKARGCIPHASGGRAAGLQSAGRLGAIADEVKMKAHQRWGIIENQIISSLRGLDQMVRRLTVLPGSRTVVWVSPGYPSVTQTQRLDAIIDRAIRAGVMVNSIDSRGLYTEIVGGDLSKGGRATASVSSQVRLMQMKTDALKQDSDVLWAIARGTGGVFFQNNNDLDAGFRMAGTLDRSSYLLAFSPSNLKRNGRYHRLEIKLAPSARSRDLVLQARHGYFAPRADQEKAGLSRDELADLVFSRQQMEGLPVRILTGTSPAVGGKCELRVEARLDTRGLHFEKREDLNVNNVTFATAVFDDDGKYVDGMQKDFKMRVRDTDLQQLFDEGLAVQVAFRLAPGTYLLRQVVGEAGGSIATRNLTVKVP